MALEALALLAARGVPLRLRIVGEGPERSALEQAAHEQGIAERVSFEGRTDRAGVRDAMAWADVFVQCSVTTPEGDREGIPNVVVEAAATGLPVVATRHGGIPETMREGETGLLVPEGEPRALAAALEALAAEPERRWKMGEAAARFVREHLDEEAQIRGHLALYEALGRGEIVPCPPPPVELPGLLRHAFGYDHRGSDHATLAAAEHVHRAVMCAIAGVGAGAERRAPSRSAERSSSSTARRLFDSLPEPVRVGAKGVAHRLFPGWIARRRAAHYRWVAKRQARFDAEIWRKLSEGAQPPELSQARSAALLGNLLQEEVVPKRDAG